MRLILLLLFATMVLTARAETNQPAVKIIVPLDRKFTEEAYALETQHLDFDQLFARLCQSVMDEAGKNPKLRLADCTRSMFGGLWAWATDKGRPSVQGRYNWGQHFIAGGAFEGYLDSGAFAAVLKETIDSHNPEDRFSLDDMGATMIGSRWMDIATNGTPEQTRRWLELWASGTMTIFKSLPNLHYGRLPEHEVAPPETIQKIREEITAGLNLPDDPPPPR